MRIVTGGAFAVFDRLMFGFGGHGESIMALQTQGLARLHEHFGIRRPVRIVARGTFAVFNRLMLELRFFEEIVVAREANLPLRTLQLDRKPRLVAFVAFLVFVGRMRDELNLCDNRSIGVHHNGLVQRLAVLIVNNRRTICPVAWTGNAVKEEVQPPLFFLGGATQQNHQPANNKYNRRQIPRERECSKIGTIWSVLVIFCSDFLRHLSFGR